MFNHIGVGKYIETKLEDSTLESDVTFSIDYRVEGHTMQLPLA